MSELLRHVIVAYDITDNRRRRQVRSILRQWRVSGQKSVSICWITKSAAETLFVELCVAVDQEHDKLMLVFVKNTLFNTMIDKGADGLLSME